MNPIGGGGSFPGIAELDRRYKEVQPNQNRPKGGIKRIKSKKSGVDFGRERPLPGNPGSLPRQVLVGGGAIQHNNVGIHKVNHPQIMRRAPHHTSLEDDDSSRRNTHLLNTSEYGSQADSELSSTNLKNSVVSGSLSQAHTGIYRFLTLCNLHIKRNPWHVYMCFQAAVFTGGEVLLRKSVYTNLYHYRWFLTQLIAILTFLAFTVLALIRCGQRWRQSRQLSVISPVSLQLPSPAKFGSRQGKQCMKKSRSVSLLDEPLLTQEYEPEPAPIETEVGALSWKEMIGIAALDTFHSFCCIPIGALPGPVTAVLPVGSPLIVTTFIQGISCQLIPLFPPMSCSQLGWILILIIGTWIFLFQAAHGVKLETEDTGAVIVFILGLGVLALSQVYKKVVLSTKVIQMEEFNLLVSPCQVLIGFLFAPLGFAIQYIHASDKTEHESYNSIGPNFANGFRCLVGKNYHHLEDTCDKAYPGVQLLAYILCIIGSRISFYYVLTWNDGGPKEAHVQLVGIVGTFIGTMLLYTDSVCQTLFGAAFEGVNTDPLGNEWAITGLIVIFVSVWMISLNADKVRPAKEFESLWLEQEDINKLKAQSATSLGKAQY